MNKENLILIIARASGTKDVSRQNLRLVHGKPLLYYVLKTSLSCSNCFTVVSTDSDEIKEYSKFYGAEVIERSQKLTKDSTPLEEIAKHALKKLNSNGKKFKKCLIIHPHFPLIKKHTIQKFLSKLDDKVRMLYGFEEKSYNDNQYAKIIDKNSSNRLNLILNNIVKTKKIVSFDCEQFLKDDSFQKEIFGLEISKDEIFSPNNYHDFAVLENILNRKKILVRVDADINIGLGHVYNMLTILNNLRNDDILILMNSKKKLGFKKFREHLYKVKFFSNEKEQWKIIRNFKPDIIFNDILNTNADYIKKLKEQNIFVVNFEDLGNGRKIADLVFNPIFESKKNLKNEYYGSKYACVREEFRVFRKKHFQNNVKKIGIIFGGVDKNNNTYKTLSIIKKSELLKNVEIDIILGIGNQHKKNLEELIKEMKYEHYKINLMKGVDLLSKYLIGCDFVITSNGRTVFEIASLEIPIISMSVNAREKQHNFVKRSKVGFHIDFDKKNLESILKQNIEKMMITKTRKQFVKNLKNEDLRKGTDRVSSKIMDEYELKLVKNF